MSRHFSLLRMFLCGGHDIPVTEVVVQTWWQHICLVERSTLLTLYLCRTPKTTFAAVLSTVNSSAHLSVNQAEQRRFI